MIPFLQQAHELYERHIVQAGNQPHLVIFLSFLLTFLAVRLLTHAIRSGRVPFLHNLSAGGVHVHHLVWGILLLLATGYVAIAFDPARDREALALLFGAGAALTLDEFALWLNLADVYWTEKGRQSIDAVVVTAAVLALLAVTAGFWAAAFDRLLDGAGLGG